MSLVPDLCLKDAAGWLETEGALLDGLVPGAAVGDWQAVLDLIRAAGWWYVYVQDGGSCRLPARARDIFALTNDRAIVLHVRPVPDVLVNFHFFSTDTIDFDFDPRELQSHDHLDMLCHFARSLGRKLGKPVLLGLEGCLPDRPAAAYDPKSQRVQVVCEVPRAFRTVHPLGWCLER